MVVAVDMVEAAMVVLVVVLVAVVAMAEAEVTGRDLILATRADSSWPPLPFSPRGPFCMSYRFSEHVEGKLYLGNVEGMAKESLEAYCQQW